MDQVDVLEEQLKLAKLERKFRKAKEDDKVTPKLKLEVREARRNYRENFRHLEGVTGVVVNPEMITTSAATKGVGN